MRGLTVVLVSAERERLASALTLAASAAALGGRARLYFDAAAVALLVDADLSLALESGVSIVACQTGLAAGVALPNGVEAGGLVSLLADLGDDRLVTI